MSNFLQTPSKIISMEANKLNIWFNACSKGLYKFFLNIIRLKSFWGHNLQKCICTAVIVCGIFKRDGPNTDEYLISLA